MADRRVVVTGGGSGIGRAIALRFAREGDAVVVSGRDPEKLARTAEQGDGRITARRLDVTDERAVRAFFSDGEGVDVLVNNAGIAHSAPFASHALDDWRALIEVNATGAFLCTREVLPAMLGRGRGRVVFVASVAALAGFRYVAGYVASKHAMLGVMRAAAAECAGTGVTANAVCPGYVRTEMTERTIDNIVAKTGRDREAALASLVAGMPLGRLVEPEEVAEAVFFLASELAGAINGQALVLDGGGFRT